MNLATLISFGAALLQLSFGTLFLLISRGHGWERGRLFAVLAFSAAGYALIDIGFSLPTVGEDWLRILGSANYLMGAIHVSGWLLYAHAPEDRPWRGLSPRHRAMVAFTLLLGLIAQVPGAITGPGVMVVEVPWLDSTYQQLNVTWYASAAGGWYLVVLAIACSRFVGDVGRGVAGAGLRIAGFAGFFACVVVELLVTHGLIVFIYPADLGFLGMVMVVLVETIRRILSDSRTLAALSRDLADQVEHRTRERDVAHEALTHAERLAVVGQLAAGVGHEINNPLTVVQVSLELLREQPHADGELIGEALDGVHRISRVVADLRSYSLPEPDHREVVALSTVLQAALKLASHRLRHVAAVDQQLETLAPVRVDAVRLSQVFLNLLINAGQALEDAPQGVPRIVIRGRMIAADRAAIEISDNGPGIAPEMLRRLGEPYVSSRHTRGGTGLGLFVARNIVDSVGGTLEFESTPGRGTRVRVTLPTVPVSVPVPIPGPVAPAAVPTPPRRRILIIDDEPVITRSVARNLSADDVTTCSDPHQALRLLETDARFDVILCDLMMPGLSGSELHAALARSRPDRLSHFLFMTGGAVTTSAEHFLANPAVRHILKPFNRAELMKALEAVASVDGELAEQPGPGTAILRRADGLAAAAR